MWQNRQCECGHHIGQHYTGQHAINPLAKRCSFWWFEKIPTKENRYAGIMHNCPCSKFERSFMSMVRQARKKALKEQWRKDQAMRCSQKIELLEATLTRTQIECTRLLMENRDLRDELGVVYATIRDNELKQAEIMENN